MYPQSMFWSKNKKNRYTPANPSFFNIKVGFKGVVIARTCFPDGITNIYLTNILKLSTGSFLFYFYTQGYLAEIANQKENIQIIQTKM